MRVEKLKREVFSLDFQRKESYRRSLSVWEALDLFISKLVLHVKLHHDSCMNECEATLNVFIRSFCSELGQMRLLGASQGRKSLVMSGKKRKTIQLSASRCHSIQSRYENIS